jgi:acyl-CoA reductase-like NAD-dependent aldehyde dehydrogenase
MENGTNQIAEVSFTNSTAVTRYLRTKCKIKNLATYALRLSGNWGGSGIKDRLEELVVEISAHGRQR